VVAPGINAKMNEVQAAFGLLQLKYVDVAIAQRKKISEHYFNLLNNVTGISMPEEKRDVKYCYSYFPILIDKNKFRKSRDDVYDELRKHNIFSRKYFYPLISQFPTYRGLDSALPGKLPVAEKICEEVLCLPVYPDLEFSTVNFIAEKIKSLSAQ
jgi:dTDP-4-amino-4,6-dideoxygalactose transaminase